MAQRTGGYAAARGEASGSADRYDGNGELRSASTLSNKIDEYGPAESSMSGSFNRERAGYPPSHSAIAPDETGAFIGSREGTPASSWDGTLHRQMNSEQEADTGRQRQS
jgi:hypothetical protein